MNKMYLLFVIGKIIFFPYLGRFRNSQQAFAEGVLIPGPFAFLAVRQSAVRQLITYPVTSNLLLRLLFPTLKKFSLKVFLRLEQLKQNQRTFGSVDGDFIKSNRTKNTSKMLRYLLGLIYYSNTIFGNISGKNEGISLYCALKCNGAQDEFFLV